MYRQFKLPYALERGDLESVATLNVYLHGQASLRDDVFVDCGANSWVLHNRVHLFREMAQTRSTRAANAKSVIYSYAGRESCPICGRAFPREVLVAHADRCAIRHFAELSGPRKGGKAGRQPNNQSQSKDTSCSTTGTDDDTSIFVTVRHEEVSQPRSLWRSFILWNILFYLFCDIHRQPP